MPKRVPEEAKRVPLNCLVLPETLAYLRAADGSQGYAVDRAVAALRMQEAQGRVMAENRAASKADKFEQRQQEVRHARRIMLQRKSQRGPRQKGDKNR